MVSAKKTERERQGWLGFLSSNQLAIYTLIALGIVTLIGTVLPQRGPGLSEPEYARLADMGGGWTAAARLGLLDIFHSIWFYALIAILCANLIACTILNFRRVYKTNTTKTLKFGPDALNQFEHLQTFKAGDLDGAKIASMIKPGRREKIDDGEYFFAESGDLHRYGAIITHFAILILAAGAIYGAALGIDGSMIIPEGEQSGTLQLRRGGELELPFQVRCNDFTLEHYENSRQPKTFRSELTYIPASGDAWDTTIEVNHPAAFGGFRFFQSSYGQMQPRLVVGVTRRADGNSLGELPVQIKRTYEVPGASAHFSVQDVADNKFNQGLAALIRETKPDAPPRIFGSF
ncbi:MAG: cytochrome c biogenesis protein ResB [Deltaproteobacteria bacterium]|nr:cytochrome c biogenesis protein ResB [Deltaproteobacteria bacterium]